MAEPIQGVPEGLKEEALPSTAAVKGVPEGLTEEAVSPAMKTSTPVASAKKPQEPSITVAERS